MLNTYEFKEINREDAKDTLLSKHYLKRMPPLSFAFGAYQNNILKGVLTFGKPPSNSLCIGVCGAEYSQYVIELNRLYTDDDTPKNLESKFISYGLKELKKKGNFIVISYSDMGMNHHGYIYQATNWLYTGESAKRTDVWVGKSGHSRTYSEEQRKFVVRKIRSMKHRYLYIVGDKRFKKEVLEHLNYPIIDEYPKGDNSNYSIGDGIENILYNKRTKEVFREKEFLANPKQFITDDEYEYYLKVYEGN